MAFLALIEQKKKDEITHQMHKECTCEGGKHDCSYVWVSPELYLKFETYYKFSLERRDRLMRARRLPVSVICVYDAPHTFLDGLCLSYCSEWWSLTRLRHLPASWFGFERSWQHFLPVTEGTYSMLANASHLQTLISHKDLSCTL